MRKSEQEVLRYPIGRQPSVMASTFAAAACKFRASICSSPRTLILSLAMGGLVSCSAQTTESETAASEISRRSNPTLEPHPEDSPYSFEEAYGERYGDEVLNKQDHNGDD